MTIDERNILIISLDIISDIKTLFYEILNLYSLTQFHYTENFLMYNKILQLTDKENKIETEPEKLLSKLEMNLSQLNSILKFLNNPNEIILSSNNIYISTESNKFLSNMNTLSEKYNISNNYIHFEENIFHELKSKQILIEKYFKNLRIKYNLKNKFFQIKINAHNLFSILIIFPSNLSNFNLNDYENKIKIIANGLFGPNNLNFEENSSLNNYSNFQLFKNMTEIFNSKFRRIIEKMNELHFFDGEKISFFECFVLFLDYVYDYYKIFNIKCDKCFHFVKYDYRYKIFSAPVLKEQNIDENYIMELINDINKGNDINNSKKIFHFYHQECINCI